MTIIKEKELDIFRMSDSNHGSSDSRFVSYPYFCVRVHKMRWEENKKGVDGVSASIALPLSLPPSFLAKFLLRN